MATFGKMLSHHVFLSACVCASALPAHEGWRQTDTGLHAELQVLELHHGQIQIPKNITHIVIEIGANGHHWLWNEPLPVAVPGVPLGKLIRDLPNVLLVSFEPLLDKYAGYVSHQSVGERPMKPGWSVPGRAIVLPFAVGSPEGSTTFYVGAMDGCSSLLPVSQKELAGPWSGANWFMFRHCSRVGGAHRRVPVVSLDTVVDRWLGGRSVSFVKVDAQGYDLSVAQSGRAVAEKLTALQLEITADHCHAGYVGATRCSETVQGMAELGFDTRANCTETRRFRNKGCASDFMFFRKGAEPLDGMPMPPG